MRHGGDPADEADRAVCSQELAEDDVAANAVASAAEATLKATFMGACRRRTAKTKTTAPTALRTRRSGARKARPKRSGTVLEHEEYVSPR